MQGFEHTGLSGGLITVVLPLGAYFFILGLLGTRRRPQMLGARADFALLVGAFCPLLVVPVVQLAGPGLLAVAALAAGGLLAWALAPRCPSWVIYNIQPSQARHCLSGTLADLGLPAEPMPGGLRAGKVTVSIKCPPVLGNVTVSLHGADAPLAARFRDNLARRLGQVESPQSTAATALLLVSAAMLVAPLAVAAQKMPEIVRILTDLMP